MPTNWNTFLGDKKALFDNEKQLALSPETTCLCHLSSQGLIKISGEDAESFLQNQLSNDVTHLSDTSHQLSAWCSPKGRILASFRVFKQNNTYYLSLSLDLVDFVIKRLRMYIMMSKVTVEDVSNEFAHFGFSGENNQIATITGKTNSFADQEVISLENITILYHSGSTPRFEIFANLSNGADSAQSLWEDLSKHATVTNENHWNYLNILSGIPFITQKSSEAWIPQMVNFTLIGGVDFKKGCYPGQEVVARLNYLGKTKRRMYHVAIDTDELPEIGETIESTATDDAGKILNAAYNPDGSIDALAVLKIAEAAKDLMLSSHKVHVLDLPYEVSD